MAAPEKNKLAVQLRTFAGELVGAAVIIQLSSQQTPGEAEDLEDLADDAMKVVQPLDGKSGPADATTAEECMQLANRAALIAGEVGGRKPEAVIRAAVAGMRAFVLRYPVIETGRGMRFRRS